MFDRRKFLGGAAILSGGLLSGCDISFGSGNGMAKDQKIYRLPDEGAPHLRTFMQWPSNPVVYPEADDLDAMQDAIASIARAVARYEPVIMLGAKEHAARIAQLTRGAVEHWDIPTDDLWCRDSGPLFVQGQNGQQTIMNFKFNAF